MVVYQREPHARQLAFDEVPQPKNRAERVELTRKALAELNLDVDVWIDDQGDTSRALFGDLPHSAILIDQAGKIQVKLSWCDPKELRQLVPDMFWIRQDKRPEPRDAGFLEAIDQQQALEGKLEAEPEDKTATHHRHTMLAHLAVTHPEHSDRDKWLAELATNGPEWQRQWAQKLQKSG